MPWRLLEFGIFPYFYEEKNLSKRFLKNLEHLLRIFIFFARRRNRRVTQSHFFFSLSSSDDSATFFCGPPFSFTQVPTSTNGKKKKILKWFCSCSSCSENTQMLNGFFLLSFFLVRSGEGREINSVQGRLAQIGSIDSLGK